MPQFNLYPAITELLAADLSLVYKTSTGAVKTITGTNLAASIKALTSRAFAITQKNSSGVLSDDVWVICNSGSTFTLTLPSAADDPGSPIYISNKGAGTVTIQPIAGNTIFGQSSIAIPQYRSAILIPDGAGMWHAFGFTI